MRALALCMDDMRALVLCMDDMCVCVCLWLCLCLSTHFVHVLVRGLFVKTCLEGYKFLFVIDGISLRGPSYPSVVERWGRNRMQRGQRHRKVPRLWKLLLLKVVEGQRHRRFPSMNIGFSPQQPKPSIPELIVAKAPCCVRWSSSRSGSLHWKRCSRQGFRRPPVANQRVLP